MCAYLRVYGLMDGAFVASLARAPSGASRSSIHPTSWKRNSPKFSCRIMHILVYEGGAMQLSTSLMDMSQHYIL